MSRRIRETADQLDRIAYDLRREAARELRRQGKTYAEIAAELGMSRARAHELCQQEPTEASA